MPLYIAEHKSLAQDKFGNPLNSGIQPPLAEQKLTISGTSGQSAAFNAGTSIIRVHTDAICSILIGNNPTATANNARLAAGQTEYFSVIAGDKLAVISNT
jgi:hypothetical protein